MKEVILITILCSVMVLGFAGVASITKAEAKPPTPSCTCPTLEQLLKEKEAQEIAARKALATSRRELIKDKLHSIIDP